MKDLKSVRDRIAEGKRLESEVDPTLVRRKQLLKKSARAIETCNACQSVDMRTYTPKGTLPTLKESEDKIHKAILL